MNSVTLYQIAKLMVMPAQCVWQYFVFSKVYSKYVYFSIFILTIGVGLTVIAELELNASVSGVFVGAVAVVSVVVEQAECQRLSRIYNTDALHFMHSSMIHRVILCSSVILGSPEREALGDLQNMAWKTLMLLLLTCILAMGVNVTNVQIIGRFGPVAMAVVGHVKTVLIFVLGFWLHPPKVDLSLAKTVIGIFIALFGAVKYGQYSAFPEADCFASCGKKKARTITIIVFLAGFAGFVGLIGWAPSLLGFALTTPALDSNLPGQNR